jgi:putative ABC transport system permease protein
MLLETFKLAMQAIRRNVLRSTLTMLGIVIGVAAVIAMVTIGNGTTAQVSVEIARLGSNLLFVSPGQFGPGRASTDAKPFTLRDAAVLKAELSGARAVAPVAQSSGTVIYGGESRVTTVIGTDNDYFISQNWSFAGGRQFLEGEISAGSATCIIGDTVYRELFGRMEAIGERIRVKNVSCEVVGILREKGESGFGRDQDDMVVVPIRTLHRRLTGNTDVSTISISAVSISQTAKLQTEIERLLRERRNLAPDQEDDFEVRDLAQMAQTMRGTTTLLTALLSAVAAVSLLVGGIGIMNIMLVSVTERTREIGIRLAIGALERQILTQFIVEAVVLSLFGGILGVLAGLGLAWLATTNLNVPFTIDASIIFVAFSFSAMIGVIFGYFPARRAAHLDPIEALRHE